MWLFDYRGFKSSRNRQRLFLSHNLNKHFPSQYFSHISLTQKKTVCIDCPDFQHLICLNIAFSNKSAIIKYIKGATDKRSAPKDFKLKVSRLTFQGEAAYFFCKSNTRIIKSNNVAFVSFMGITPFQG